MKTMASDFTSRMLENMGEEEEEEEDDELLTIDDIDSDDIETI